MVDDETTYWSHYDHMKNMFATSKRFKVNGSGDDAILTDGTDHFMIDISKDLVQSFELNPRLSQLLLKDGKQIYFYTYLDLLLAYY